MLLPTNVQLFYFFTAICSGLIIGVMFDIYRVIRGFNCPKKILTAISDILFWIFTALIVFIFMILTNRGDFRAYTFIGICAGLFFYIKIISSKFIYVFRFILYYSLKTIRIGFSIIIFPIKLLIYGLRYFIIIIRSKKRDTSLKKH